MKKLVILSTLLFSCLPLTGQAKEICNRSRKELFQQFKTDENRIAFENDGGLFNGGVCWWHSRLQRSSVYLARFSPEKQKPTQAEAEAIVNQLAHLSGVVEIPGYQNFYEFSLDHPKIIQHELNQWQKRDGFLNQQWIRGLSGKNHLSADQLKSQMNNIFGQFQKSEPGLWLMVQMKGITSHALLLLNMVKTEQGYLLTTIDSNFPDTTVSFDYHFGDTFLRYGGSTFVPYAGFQKDMLKINQALEQYCGN